MDSTDQIYRSPKTLSYLTVIGLAVIGLCDFFSAAFGIGQIFNPTPTINLEDEGVISVWLLMQSLALLFKFPAYIFTIVVFLMWVYRASKNLLALHTRDIKYTPGWAVGWWLVPVVNLVVPFFIISELWSKSDPNYNAGGTLLKEDSGGGPANLLYYWWFFWIVANIAFNAASMMFDTKNAQNLEYSGHLFLASGTLWLIAAIMAIKVVLGITRHQETRFQQLNPID